MTTHKLSVALLVTLALFISSDSLEAQGGAFGMIAGPIANTYDIAIQFYDPGGFIEFRVPANGIPVISLAGSAGGPRTAGITVPGPGNYNICVVGIKFAGSHVLDCKPVMMPPLVQFIRGDVDGNGLLQIKDAFAIIRFLRGAGFITCLDAADVDDSGRVSGRDSFFILRRKFSSTSPPPPPFPSCGEDPTPDLIGCASHGACP